MFLAGSVFFLLCMTLQNVSLLHTGIFRRASSLGNGRHFYVFLFFPFFLCAILS